jgi:hypothetical protein
VKSFIERTFRPFFIVTGAGTALAACDALWPQRALENIQQISFVPDYTIIVQHWGAMVGLMGVFMIVAAFRDEWRKPILIYSAIEKAFMVYLVLTNRQWPYARGFFVPAAIDAAVVLYTIVYFCVYGLSGVPDGRRAR